MGDKISLRSLLGFTALAAIIFGMIRIAVVNQGDYAVAAVVVACLMILITFASFAAAFIILLPFGIISAMSKERMMPGTSPFAHDRLPDQQIPVKDSDIAK